VLDSRAAVGLGERNLLPGHVCEWGHHVGLQNVFVSPVDDSFAGFQKNNSLGGCRGKRFINRSVVSSLGMSANPVTMVAFREFKLLWCILLMIWPLCNSLSSYFCERILNRTHHNTSDSLKASVVAGIADIEATRESKVLLGYR